MPIITKEEISFLTFDIYEKYPLLAAVSTRLGGISEAPFSSLNMGLHVGDVPAAVVKNRRHFFHALGSEASRLVNCNQVHGTHIEVVGKADCGRGAESVETAIPACDGLITAEKRVPITMNYADCTPLFFYDPKKEVIALSHGGWRGTAGNIAGKTIEKMEKEFQCARDHILCAIGPAIGKEAFEVGGEVIEVFQTLFSDTMLAALCQKKENGKYLFDLHGANRELMKAAGIPEDHIEDCGICTFSRDDLFYSYRKSGGKTGRHMAVMELVSSGQ